MPTGQLCEALGGFAQVPCPAGFICTGQTAIAHTTDNLCPKGKVCPPGSAEGEDCAKGTYAPFRGMSECLICPPGFFCNDPDSDLKAQMCPAGHFCTAGEPKRLYTTVIVRRDSSLCRANFFHMSCGIFELQQQTNQSLAPAGLSAWQAICPMSLFVSLAHRGTSAQRPACQFDDIWGWNCIQVKDFVKSSCPAYSLSFRSLMLS